MAAGGAGCDGRTVGRGSPLVVEALLACALWFSSVILTPWLRVWFDMLMLCGGGSSNWLVL